MTRPYKDMEILKRFSFTTLGKQFWGIVLTIQEKTPQIGRLVKSWGYQLENSETLTMLWPPAAQIDDISVIASHDVFLFTSFGLQPHGNINTYQRDIASVSSWVSKISIKHETKIVKNNVAITIDKHGQDSMVLDKISLIRHHENTFTVPDDDSQYFLFNDCGVMPLDAGQRVSLSPQSVIKYYLFGYLMGEIIPIKKEIKCGRALLDDIRAHYKRTEKYNNNTFSASALSEIALGYIKECESSGLINSAAKRFIKEGRL